MKQCPKCNASIIDTAKFCSKCGVNIKKYEEENTKSGFCPECGNTISGGDFCTECGFRINITEINAIFRSNDCSDNDLYENNESYADSTVVNEADAQLQIKKALSAFEYDEHADGTYTITGLKDKTAFQYTVPSKVVAISDRAFEGCNAIKITLPENLLRIGNYAFKGCNNLTNINLPDSLVIVGDEAFAECELLDIEFPVSIRKIGKDAIKNTIQDKILRKRIELEAVQKKELVKWEIGGNPVFGSYYQKDLKQPIEWIVLARNGSNALLISKYLLDCKSYNTEFVHTTWESSTLRKWLNNEFLREAFNSTEQQKIQSTSVTTSGSNATIDKIFILSIDEAERYFTSNDKRKCIPTAHAISNGVYAYRNGCGYWWLRSPGQCQNQASGVHSDGDVYKYGYQVTRELMGVRPALWINLES